MQQFAIILAHFWSIKIGEEPFRSLKRSQTLVFSIGHCKRLGQRNLNCDQEYLCMKPRNCTWMSLLHILQISEEPI